MTTTPVDLVKNNIGSGVDDAEKVISDNMPVVFGVAIAFVAWNIGKRVLGKI